MFHFAAGVIGMLAGLTALVARKGSPVHIAAGRTFVAAMVTAAGTAVYLAFASDQPGFGVGAVLIIYMLTTAWMAARRPEGKIGAFEIIAFLLAASGSALSFFFAFQSLADGTAFMGGIPAFSISTVIGLAALADLTVILRRGLRGRQRIARHVWRMHMGLFAAVGSFFPGQLQFFPAYIREVEPIIILFIPAFSVVGVMLVWLAIVYFSRRFRRVGPTASNRVEPPQPPLIPA